MPNRSKVKTQKPLKAEGMSLGFTPARSAAFIAAFSKAN